MERGLRRRAIGGVVAAAALVLLAGCGSDNDNDPLVVPASSMPPGSSGQPPQSAPAKNEAVPDVAVETVVDGLDVPWGLASLDAGNDDGTLLITLRDAARLVVVDTGSGTGEGTTTDVTGPGADQLATETTPDGEGGLLGVAVAPEDSDAPGDVFVYRTGADDNAVLRGTLDGAELGELTTVVDGIPRASNHDGGALAFGPDGYLYVGTGDASDSANAQDPGSLGGKILRVTTDGDPAPGNPDDSSPVWSLGHRNVQGLGWDADDRMFASEFGQNTYDELNVIEPGGNYGWPDVEGPGDDAAQGDEFVSPVAWWSPADASPSGLAVTDDAVYLAGLRGERLWRVPFLERPPGAGVDAEDPDDAGAHAGLGEPQDLLVGELGRLRNVAPVGTGDSDGLWVLTNNTDGRGTPGDGDDRLVRVTVD